MMGQFIKLKMSESEKNMRKVSQIINGKRVIVKKPELLAPAGNLEKLKVAIRYGADAVFVGGKEFSLRSQASNFSIEDIKEAVEFANQYGAKIHVTCNIVMHEENLEGISQYLKTLDEIGVTAIIVADPYIMILAKQLNLKLQVHVSTQLSSTNAEVIKFWQKQGIERVVLAREVDLSDLKLIMDEADIEVEYFVHGALCIAYSGRCMLSNYYSRRDANRGGCSQSCRWYYDLYKDGVKINTEDMPAFSMSSKDLALINHIGELIELGVDSFKIEGRMKSLHYIATVVSSYRKLIDAYCADPDNFVLGDNYEKEIHKAANRALTTAFFNRTPNFKDQLFNLREEHPTQEFCIRVLGYNPITKLAKIEQRNYFKVGDFVEFFSPNKDNFVIEVKELFNEDMEKVEIANHPMEILYLKVEQKLDQDDLARKVI